MASPDHDPMYFIKRGSELPISIRDEDQYTTANPYPAWFINMWSTVFVWTAYQNPPESPNMSMGNLQHGPTNHSGRDEQNAITIRDTDEYIAQPTFQHDQIRAESSTVSMENADLGSSIIFGESAISIEDEEYVADQLSTEYVVHNTQNPLESKAIRIDDGFSVRAQKATPFAINIIDINEYHPTHFESTNNQKNLELTSTGMENADQDSSILTGIASGQIATSARDEEHTIAELQNYSNPKFAKYFFGAYAIILAAFAIKGVTKKHSLFHDHIPFMIISIGACLLATLNLAVMSCIHDHFRSSSHQRFSPALYYVFHISCVLALCSPLPALFNTQE